MIDRKAAIDQFMPDPSDAVSPLVFFEDDTDIVNDLLVLDFICIRLVLFIVVSGPGQSGYFEQIG